MRKLMIACCLALALPGCAALAGLGGIPPAPSSFADKTKVDEIGFIALSSSVEVAATLATVRIKAGGLSLASLNEMADASARARSLLAAAEATYNGANSASYVQAATELSKVVQLINSIAKRSN